MRLRRSKMYRVTVKGERSYYYNIYSLFLQKVYDLLVEKKPFMALDKNIGVRIIFDGNNIEVTVEKVIDASLIS